jgi:hypothetical protein
MEPKFEKAEEQSMRVWREYLGRKAANVGDQQEEYDWHSG